MKKLKKHSDLLMLRHLFYAYGNKRDGKLNGLMTIYESYGNPVNLSPFDVFANPVQRILIEEFQRRLPDENLIEYGDDDILVNPMLLKVYLQLIDYDNFKRISVGFDKMLVETTKSNRSEIYNHDLIEFGNANIEYHHNKFCKNLLEFTSSSENIRTCEILNEEQEDGSYGYVDNHLNEKIK